jgi:hypothetical protein
LEKRAEQVLPGRGGGWGEKEKMGVGGKNGSNNVCTCEWMNKKIHRERNIITE